MGRPPRADFPGALLHVMSRGNARQDIVRDDIDRVRFLELLGDIVTGCEWILHTYTLMTNHYHLALELTRSSLSDGMQQLNGEYAKQFNKRHGRVGHLFQSRFKHVLIESGAHFREVLRYIVLNPVPAGMTSHPSDYRWSSFRAIAGDCAAPPWLAVNRTLATFGGDPDAARAEYRAFVEAGVTGTPCPWDQAVRGAYLGSPAWLKTLKLECASASGDRDRQRGRPRATDMADIIRAVAAAMNFPATRITAGRGGVARIVAAWLGRHYANLDLRSIAEGLTIQSAGATSMMIARCERKRNADSGLREVISSCVATLRGVEK